MCRLHDGLLVIKCLVQQSLAFSKTLTNLKKENGYTPDT